MDEQTIVSEIVLSEGSPLEASLVIRSEGILSFDGYVLFKDEHFNRERILPWFIAETTLSELVEAEGRRLHADLVAFANEVLRWLVIPD